MLCQHPGVKREGGHHELFYTIEKMIYLFIERLKTGGIDTETEVLTYANSTPYGLSATLWTENLKRAHRVSAQLKSGIIWVNCWLFRDLRTPFGGMKQSGVGREGGWEALRFFTDAKNICIKL